MIRRVKLTTPLSLDDVRALQAGDAVALTGRLYTARDAAHLRMMEALKQGRELPFPLEGQVIYYLGPCPAPPGEIIGSAGPTTSQRLDSMTPPILEKGLRGMIGKGPRSLEVKAAMQKWGAVYFAAIGGIGALLSQYIKAKELVAYPDLGAEAVLLLEVVDLPLIVAVDSRGNDLYQIGREAYRCKVSQPGGKADDKK